MTRTIRTLYVLYDSRCGLCAAIKAWLSRQPKLVGLAMVPAQSAEAARLLRGSPPPLPDELTVISDTGWIWRGDHAWVMALWALRDYRDWAKRLSQPALLPLARRAFATLSNYRGTISTCFGLGAES